jgi:hypothetical protein
MSVAGAYSAEFAEFERHKKTLLDHLRSAYELGLKSKPFDEDYLWHRLRGAAFWVFRRQKNKHRTVLPARRKERLRDLANAVRRARGMVEKAKQDDVGWDLFSGWCAEANITPASPGDGLLRIIDEIKKAVAGLATLEAAASRAARDLPTKAGSPSGTGILPTGDINALMAVYRTSTGLEPNMGTGPFVELVEKFLTAVGKTEVDTKQDYVFEALKYANKRARKEAQRSAASRPSMNSRPRE